MIRNQLPSTVSFSPQVFAAFWSHETWVLTCPQAKVLNILIILGAGIGKESPTCYARNVYQNWVLSISTGAEILSSAISSIVFLLQRMLAPCTGKNIDDLLKSFPVDVQGSFITQRASDWKGLSWKWNWLGLAGVSKIPSKGWSCFGGSWGDFPWKPTRSCRWPQSWDWWFRMGIEIVSFIHWPKNFHQKHATSTRSRGTPQAKNEKNSPAFTMYIIFPTCPFWGVQYWFLLVLV